MNELGYYVRRLIVRLAFYFTLLIITTMAVFTYYATKDESKNVTNELRQQAVALADNIAASVASYILVRDYTSIESILLRAAQFPGISNIQAIDTRSRMLSDVYRTPENELKPRFDAFNVKLPLERERQVVFNERDMVVWQPVVLGDVIGWIKLSYSLDIVEQRIDQIWENKITDGVSLVLLSICMLITILRKPLRSIRKYTAFADELDECDGKQLPVDKSAVELTKLGTALNRASHSLYDQSKALNNALKQFERVASIAEYSPDIVLSIDKDGAIQYANTRAKGLAGDLFDDEKKANKLLPPNMDELLRRCCKENNTVSGMETKVGDRTFMWKFSPFHPEQVLHCHGVEITERKQAEQALHNSEIRYRTLFDTAHDAIFLIHNDRFVDCNPSAAAMFGSTVSELKGQSPRQFFPTQQPGGTDSNRSMDALLKQAKDGGAISFEWQIKRLDGKMIDVEVNLNLTELESGRHILAIVRDITLRKEAEAKLIRQANYDTLTDLPNRILAFDRLQLAIKQAQRLKTGVGVLFIDVDKFKSVNDTMGHSVGDELIVEVGDRLSACVRGGDTVARLGGDEFLVILNNITDIVDCEVVVEKILETMAKPFIMHGQEFFLSASIGVTGYPNDANDPHTLLRYADAAMYRAKDSGRNTFQFYTPEINEQAQRRVKMEALLRRAIEKRELFLTYQPQIDIQSQRLVGAEALIRWHNSELGLVRPDQFISLAEDTGLIVPIGEWVIQTACREARQWYEQFNIPLRVSVNVSQRQFRGTGLVAAVYGALKASDLPAQALELEITESLLVDDAPEILEVIKGLKALGVTLALDDFGTGYSSLSYLKSFPFDVLKIDRSFVRDITSDPEDAALCEAIIAIAENTGLSVVGEGVETEAQLAFLKDKGTDLAQGFYFSKPLNSREFRHYINTNTEKVLIDSELVCLI